MNLLTIILMISTGSCPHGTIAHGDWQGKEKNVTIFKTT